MWKLTSGQRNNRNAERCRECGFSLNPDECHAFKTSSPVQNWRGGEYGFDIDTKGHGPGLITDNLNNAGGKTYVARLSARFSLLDHEKEAEPMRR